jgi:hypothetical protein
MPTDAFLREARIYGESLQTRGLSHEISNEPAGLQASDEMATPASQSPWCTGKRVRIYYTARRTGQAKGMGAGMQRS